MQSPVLSTRSCPVDKSGVGRFHMRSRAAHHRQVDTPFGALKQLSLDTPLFFGTDRRHPAPAGHKVAPPPSDGV
jgi:hypothetical protein